MRKFIFITYNINFINRLIFKLTKKYKKMNVRI